MLIQATKGAGKLVRASLRHQDPREHAQGHQAGPAARSGWFLAEVYQFVDDEGIETVQDLRGFFTSKKAARECGPKVAAAWEVNLCEPIFGIKMLTAAQRSAGGGSSSRRARQ
eukprot:9471320-Heterocapsa_arctica.AAC.1